MAAVPVHERPDAGERAVSEPGTAKQGISHLVNGHLRPDEDPGAVGELEREGVQRVVGAHDVRAEVPQQVDVAAELGRAEGRPR